MVNKKKKPVIGISSIEKGNFDGWFETFHMHQCRADACHAVWKGGGVPLILPAMPDQKCVEAYFNSIDGLFITGGYDVLPFIYGEDMH